jgi:hypothetical protein
MTKKRIIYLLCYIVFALILPIFIINAYLPLLEFFKRSPSFQIASGGTVAILFILIFLRKHIIKFAKDFDQVTAFKGFFMWLVYVFPIMFAFAIVFITHKFGDTFVPILGYTMLSHFIAGVFHTLAEKERVEKVKKWIKE